MIKYNQTIALLCSVWDDPRGVMRMLSQDTIQDFNYIYFFDGKFKDWNAEPEFNVDEVENIVKDFGITHDMKILYELVGDKTEAEKRNHMFYRAYQLRVDWSLVVDADEIPYIDKHKWNEEKALLANSSFGCHSVVLDNYGLLQRRPRLFNMREQPYLIQHSDNTSHNHIYSSRDGRDMAQDITKTTYDVKSITLKHDKEFYSKYRFECRNRYATVKNH